MNRFIYAIKTAFFHLCFAFKNYKSLKVMEEETRKQDWDDYWATRF
jgi:hypothetical protein